MKINDFNDLGSALLVTIPDTEVWNEQSYTLIFFMKWTSNMWISAMPMKFPNYFKH